MTSFNEADRRLLRAIAESRVDDAWCWEETGLAFWDKMDADPTWLAVELLRLTDGDLDLAAALAAVERRQLMQRWPEVAIEMMRRRPEDAALIGDRAFPDVVSHRPELRLLPGDVVLLGLRERADWAFWAVVSRCAEWGEPRAERWLDLADLLAAASVDQIASDLVIEQIDEKLLSKSAWSKHDPSPAVPPFIDERGKPRKVDGSLFTTTPYRSLFPLSDGRVQRAIAEVAAFEEAVRRCLSTGPDVRVWLPLLSNAIPGCGVHNCCRPGLFEAELVLRGHVPENWPVLPRHLT